MVTVTSINIGMAVIRSSQCHENEGWTGGWVIVIVVMVIGVIIKR
jgi:hypothetical protein